MVADDDAIAPVHSWARSPDRSMLATLADHRPIAELYAESRRFFGDELPQFFRRHLIELASIAMLDLL
jgi:hypothetical protein